MFCVETGGNKLTKWGVYLWKRDWDTAKHRTVVVAFTLDRRGTSCGPYSRCFFTRFHMPCSCYFCCDLLHHLLSLPTWKWRKGSNKMNKTALSVIHFVFVLWLKYHKLQSLPLSPELCLSRSLIMWDYNLVQKL